MATAWYRVPLRAATAIDAPAEAARRALRDPEVWARAATATGGSFELSTDAPQLAAGQLVKFRPRAVGRRYLLEVEADTELPVLSPVEGSVRTWIRIVTAVVETPTGCTASVRLEWLGATRSLDPTLRPALLRYGEMLLGIATLVAREPVRVVAGAIVVGDRVLVARRRIGAAGMTSEAGRWELPGGKVQPGESDEAALERELVEELGLRTTARERVGPSVLIRPGVQLICYRVERTGDEEMVLVDHDEARWVDADQLAALDLLDADRALLEPLRRVLETRS